MSKLDKNIKDLFENYRVDYDPQSWSAMEDKINSELDPDGQFDRDVQDKLKEYTEPYDPTSWPDLERKMLANIAIRKKILTTKFLESLVILLLIFSVVNYSNTPIIPKKKINFADNIPSHKMDQSAPAEIGKIKVQVESATGLQNPLTQTPRRQAPTGQIPIINNSRETIKDPKAATIKEKTTSNRYAAAVSKDINANSVDQTNDNTPGNTDLVNIKNNSDYVSTPVEKENTSSAPSLERDNILDVLPTNIHYLAIDQDIALELPAMTFNTPIKVVEEREKYIGVMASLDANLINRPFDFQLLQDQINYGDFGYSFGVLFASKVGRHEVETGILYSLHSSDPNLNETIAVENSYYLREFYLQKFDQFKIPLDFKYHLIDNDYNNFYASIGVDIHIIGDATYKFTDNLKSGIKQPRYKIEQRSTLEKRKDLKGGLFDGGKLQDNSFVNIGGGIGYIRNVGSYSIFTEANYKHHIFAAKLGPINEKIHTLSFKIGARKRI